MRAILTLRLLSSTPHTNSNSLCVMDLAPICNPLIIELCEFVFVTESYHLRLSNLDVFIIIVVFHND